MIAESIETVCGAIGDAVAGRRRILVGIAGPPGAGKSTLSSSLHARLDAAGYATAVVPMDGFHLDNAVLQQRGLLQRKGAPETFDADGFIEMVETLRQRDVPVAVPVFDREADAVRDAAETVPESCTIVLVEGNYLLLDRAPWTRLAALLDLTVFVTAPSETLRERLVQRWLDHGHDRQQAEARAAGNDIPNAMLVLEHSLAADISCSFESGENTL